MKIPLQWDAELGGYVDKDRTLLITPPPSGGGDSVAQENRHASQTDSAHTNGSGFQADARFGPAAKAAIEDWVNYARSRTELRGRRISEIDPMKLPLEGQILYERLMGWERVAAALMFGREDTSPLTISEMFWRMRQVEEQLPGHTPVLDTANKQVTQGRAGGRANRRDFAHRRQLYWQIRNGHPNQTDSWVAKRMSIEFVQSGVEQVSKKTIQNWIIREKKAGNL